MAIIFMDFSLIQTEPSGINVKLMFAMALQLMMNMPTYQLLSSHTQLDVGDQEMLFITLKLHAHLMLDSAMERYLEVDSDIKMQIFLQVSIF
jgi:hypothetical protein